MSFLFFFIFGGRGGKRSEWVGRRWGARASPERADARHDQGGEVRRQAQSEPTDDTTNQPLEVRCEGKRWASRRTTRPANLRRWGARASTQRADARHDPPPTGGEVRRQAQSEPMHDTTSQPQEVRREGKHKASRCTPRPANPRRWGAKASTERADARHDWPTPGGEVRRQAQSEPMHDTTGQPLEVRREGKHKASRCTPRPANPRRWGAKASTERADARHDWPTPGGEVRRQAQSEPMHDTTQDWGGGAQEETQRKGAKKAQTLRGAPLRLVGFGMLYLATWRRTKVLGFKQMFESVNKKRK